MAAAAVACAIGMVTAKNPIHAALWLVGNFISLAVIYLMLSAPLLFAIQLIVYAGAIMVLFLFVIMFFMSPETRRWLHPPLRSQLVFGGLASLALIALLAYGSAVGMGSLGYSDPFKQRDIDSTRLDPAATMGDRPEDLSVWIFSYQVLPFELTSLLLLAALLGSIMVARDAKEEGRGKVVHHAPVAEVEA
ncbi:MAG: NADH-quinone oxidoreductase subunit J [bacterium]|nr:NADH-quinone oxidoreductase subunit J [bacterium]